MKRPLSQTAHGRVRYRSQVLPELGDALVAVKAINGEKYEELENHAHWQNQAIEDLLVSSGAVPEQTLWRTLSELSGIPMHTIVPQEVDLEALSYVSPEHVINYHIMPLFIDGDHVFIAADRVPELNDEDDLRILLGHSIQWVLTTRREIDESVKHFYGVGLHAFLGLARPPQSSEATLEIGSPDISGLVKEIIVDAMQSNASDIHWEPGEDNLALRYRIDGVLVPVPLPEGIARYRPAIISRIKVMAQMNIAERRLPKDGRFTLEYDGKSYDIRVSVLPAHHGEEVALRLLNRESSLRSIEELGMHRDQLQAYQRMLNLTHGMVLFTGPTGSGKSTSLYATIESIKSQNRKIVTLEDPVEYELNGITQIQINPVIDFSFARGLRSVLRHDPDVVLVGEIRDNETAEITVSAAMTGHLVFSTLHTNDSVSALNRLVDMGIERFLVASSVEGVIAQRLVRLICVHCRTPVEPEDDLGDEILETTRDEKVTAFKGTGCPHCHFTGYAGRQSLFEVCPMTDALRGHIMNHAPSSTLMDQARENGMITLRESGWRAVQRGETSIEEVLRVAQA